MAESGAAPAAVPARRHRLLRLPETFRGRLALTLVGVSLLSMAVLGVFNYFTTRDTLTEGITDQLDGLQASSARRIRNGLAAIQGQVSTLARQQEVVDGMVRLSGGFDELGATDTTLDADEAAALATWYEDNVVDAVLEAGLPAVTAEELLPQSDAGRYLQYHYIVENPFPDERWRLDDAGDGSDYSAEHAAVHPGLVELVEQSAFGTLALVDLDADVVYTTDKRIDFGTNLFEGPYSDSLLATTLVDRLAAAPVGDAVFVDFERYLPASGEPQLFVAAAIRSDAEVVGAVFVQVPVAALNAVTTADGQWEAVGLGDTGEVYVVGPDMLMRSDSRLFLEDPEAYLEAAGDAGESEEVLSAIDLFGSTVLLQTIDTEPVATAAEGQTFVGTTRNYLGDRTLTVAGPVGADGLDWVIVADLGTDEANEPLNRYLVELLILVAIVLPIVAALGLLLARRLARPVQPLLEAAERVGDGDLQSRVEDLGDNEFGDLGRQINALTEELQIQRNKLVAEEQEITDVLLAVLPARVVEQVRRGDRNLADVVDTATVISLTVTGAFDGSGLDPEEAADLSAQLSQRLEQTAADHGVERVRSSSAHHLFTAGLGQPDAEQERAARFVVAVEDAIADVGERAGVDLDHHAGLSAGRVVAGMLVEGQLSYGVVGDASRLAMALDAVASSGQVLVDDTVASALGDEWALEPVQGLVDVAGESIAAKQLRRRSPTLA